MKKIYVLHEYGAYNHFIALNHLANEKDTVILFREFSIIKHLVKSVIKLDFDLLKKQIVNFLFLLNLILNKNKNIIIGIAPFDFRLSLLRLLLKQHNVFYFTSWTNWENNYYPKKKFAKSQIIQKAWKSFIEKDVKGVFCVTKSSLKSISSLYNIKCTKSVVYHSVESINVPTPKRTGDDVTRLIYVGRLDNNKGIDELFALMQKLDKDKYKLTIVGKGEKRHEVEKFAKENKNIEYLGFISSKKDLYKVYQNSDIQLLFSRKHDNWQEVFGMVIIEAMYNGVPTISTNHTGPLEIINNNVSGWIIKDDMNIVYNVEKLLKSEKTKLFLKNNNLKNYAKNYLPNQLASKWEDILKYFL